MFTICGFFLEEGKEGTNEEGKEGRKEEGKEGRNITNITKEGKKGGRKGGREEGRKALCS